MFIKQTLISIKQQTGPDTKLIGGLNTMLSSPKLYQDKNQQIFVNIMFTAAAYNRFFRSP
jgi:hypothetical protein